MSKREFIDKAKKQFADIFLPDKERIDRLRQILETEQKRSVSQEEATEIASQLISFYECLAGSRRIVRGGINKARSNNE